jgi:hypothetical protein
MSALLECLNHLSGVKLGTVVHVNPADDDVISHYVERGAKRIVLVSADPDAVPALHRTARGRTGVSVVEAVVASQAREAQWLRFNVRELSGLLQAGSGLRTLYPRLRVLEQTQVVTMTLQSLLEQIGPTPAEQGAQNMLVLEAPGMEGALLQGLSSQLLGAFGLVLVRGAVAGLFENADEHEGTLLWLHERFYRRLTTGGDADSLWPVALMCYDGRAAEQAAAARRIGELLAQIERLCKARDEQAQTLAAGKAQAEKLAQDRLAQVEVLAKARDEQAKLAAERLRHIAQLETELTDLTARQGMLREELIKAEAHVELISDLVLREKVR